MNIDEAKIASPIPSGPPTRADDPAIVTEIDSLIKKVTGRSGDFDTRLVRELVQTSLKLLSDGRDTGEVKLMTAALKELRYAYRVFGRYADAHKVTIFGSARTPEDHPDYIACVEFGRLMAQLGWMVITGAGLGIMKAGHVGPGKAASFGVAIRLPFETNANDVIAGDEKLINFRYFFTRKLMFISQSEAVVLFPGGFGTMDEAFETLTLVQTGKTSPVPIVCCEGAGGDYWPNWHDWVKRDLLDKRFISPEDLGLYYVAKDPADAAQHVARFYRNYHSSRYVKDDFVIRLRGKLSEADLDRLNTEFAVLVRSGGKMELSSALDGESDARDLPRLVFPTIRNKFGTLRRLIDRINECELLA
jgi:uncharacterized protein (TIGR00730 family)